MFGPDAQFRGHPDNSPIKYDTINLICENGPISKIILEKNHGVPRTGRIQYCNNSPSETIHYLNSSYSKNFEMTFSFMQINGDSIKVYAQNDFNIKVVDVVTGDVSFITNGVGQPSFYITLSKKRGEPVKQLDGSVTSPEPRDCREITSKHPASSLDNPGTIVVLPNLSNGIYFIIISEIATNNVLFVKTLIKD